MTAYFAKIACVLTVTLFALPAGAQTVTSSVRIAGALHPRSEQEARILLDRVKMAAAEVCGASQFSVAGYSEAVRRSPCWRQSVSDAVAQIANPILSDLYRRESQ